MNAFFRDAFVDDNNSRHPRIPPLIPYLIYLQNKTISTEVGQSMREFSHDWTTRFRLGEIFPDKIRILC